MAYATAVMKEAQIVCKDTDGNPLTEEAYQQYAQTYFKKQAIRKIHFCSAGRI